MLQITLITEKYELKEGRKTVFELKETETKIIDSETHKMIVDASPFFKKLGGSEVLERSYTCAGYVVTKITSKSPDRDVKTVRKFKFDYIN